MNLIKVGSRYINLDNVYQISFNDAARENHPGKEVVATLDVITSSSTYDESNSPIEAAGMNVFGQEAEALRWWLGTKATNIEKHYQKELARQEQQHQQVEEDKEFALFLSQSGIPIESQTEANLYRNFCKEHGYKWDEGYGLWETKGKPGWETPPF